MEPFVSTDDLGDFLRRELTGDLMAEMAVGSACETLRDMIGQDLVGVVDDAVTLDGPGTDALLLPQTPVHEVASVLQDGEEVDSETYYLNKVDGALYRKVGTWRRGRGRFEVTYTHGWNAYSASGSGGLASLPPLPRTLHILAVTLAARIYDQGLVKNEKVGTYSVIYSAESALSMTKGEIDIVAKYRRRSSM